MNADWRRASDLTTNSPLRVNVSEEQNAFQNEILTICGESENNDGEYSLDDTQ